MPFRSLRSALVKNFSNNFTSRFFFFVCVLVHKTFEVFFYVATAGFSRTFLFGMPRKLQGKRFTVVKKLSFLLLQ